jgi:hypothetical protein
LTIGGSSAIPRASAPTSTFADGSRFFVVEVGARGCLIGRLWNLKQSGLSEQRSRSSGHVRSVLWRGKSPGGRHRTCCGSSVACSMQPEHGGLRVVGGQMWPFSGSPCPIFFTDQARRRKRLALALVKIPHAISHNPQYGMRFEVFAKSLGRLMERSRAYSV